MTGRRAGKSTGTAHEPERKSYMSVQKGIAVLTALVFCLFAGAAALAQESYGPVRVLIPVTGGLEKGSLSKLMQDVAGIIEKESGYKFVYSEATYRMGDDDSKLVADAFRAKKAEMTYIRSYELISREDEWKGLFKPAFMFIFDGTNSQEECFYVLEKSGMKTIKDLRGKTWGGSRTYVPRLILHENGIDEPLSQFFGNTKYVEDAPPAKSIQALRNGTIDVVSVNKHHLAIGGAGVMSEGDDKEKSMLKYKAIACAPGELNWVFAFRKDVPDDVVQKITKVFVTAHKSEAFKPIRFIFTAIKGGFSSIKESDFKRTRELAALTKKFGWDKEQVVFTKEKRDKK